MKRHRWGPKIHFPIAHKTERSCLDCPITKVSRAEWEGGREVRWTEFWRDGDRIECTGTPACEPITAEVA